MGERMHEVGSEEGMKIFLSTGYLRIVNLP